MKILETERLYLRKFIIDDVEWLAKIYSDTEVMMYIAKGVVIHYDLVKKGI